MGRIQDAQSPPQGAHYHEDSFFTPGYHTLGKEYKGMLFTGVDKMLVGNPVSDVLGFIPGWGVVMRFQKVQHSCPCLSEYF